MANSTTTRGENVAGSTQRIDMHRLQCAMHARQHSPRGRDLLRLLFLVAVLVDTDLGDLPWHEPVALADDLGAIVLSLVARVGLLLTNELDESGVLLRGSLGAFLAETAKVLLGGRVRVGSGVVLRHV